MVIIRSLAQRIAPYFSGLPVKQSACASSARVLYLSIYAGLPVSGERNKNQNYAYVTLLFRRLLEASVNTEHVFTWLNTNGHTRTALLMYIVHHNDNL